ncbi:hypothetical protein TWF594_001396 [Orbilia oligospora]|nr:hypothetical protein TWF103_001192 [Orbilia oligospora]KAF3116459.1 hypothetical protein TWF706_004093 [Orbilia oligospora]KAF3148203.1 hypothetical protein TWF594_001396 [Orbilia oligospora]
MRVNCIVCTGDKFQTRICKSNCTCKSNLVKIELRGYIRLWETKSSRQKTTLRLKIFLHELADSSTDIEYKNGSVQKIIQDV